jgi:DNA polymerase V
MRKRHASLYALIDCNNFYASCERVFQPELKNIPLIILSNNDGCVVARSNEAKKLGIPMGVPFFKVRPLVERGDVRVRSSNYELYGDMSRRVMQTLQRLAPDVEIYSIDEAFCDLSGFTDHDLAAFARELRETILRWTGIPVSIGIAPTKTLAKAANHAAKKADGILVLRSEAVRHAVLGLLPTRDVWGIGRQHEKLLASYGINTALEFAQAPDAWIRRYLRVTGLRTAFELRGIACIPIEEQSPAKKSLATTRMFGRPITAIEELIEATASYAARATEKLRRECLQARHIEVFFHSSPFKEPYYQGSASYSLPVASDYAPEFIRYASHGVRAQFRPGFRYIKAGILLSDLTHPYERQLSFLDETHTEKRDAIMRTVDVVNRRWGKNSLFYASAGIQRTWSMKREMRSRSYTTRLDELLCVPS